MFDTATQMYKMEYCFFFIFQLDLCSIELRLSYNIQIHNIFRNLLSICFICGGKNEQIVCSTLKLAEGIGICFYCGAYSRGFSFKSIGIIYEERNNHGNHPPHFAMWQIELNATKNLQ